jgi:hypothetical protein
VVINSRTLRVAPYLGVVFRFFLGILRIFLSLVLQLHDVTVVIELRITAREGLEHDRLRSPGCGIRARDDRHDDGRPEKSGKDSIHGDHLLDGIEKGASYYGYVRAVVQKIRMATYEWGHS